MNERIPYTLFRCAEKRQPTWNLTKTLIQTVIFWIVFLGIIPFGIMAIERAVGIEKLVVPWPLVVSWLFFAMASGINLWSGITMAIAGKGTPLPTDGPRHLVVTGPYAFVRNPMALAGLSQGAAIGLIFGSWLTLLYVLTGGVLWDFAIRPIEEKHLKRFFGDDFRDYQLSVQCWLPNWLPYRSLEKE